MSKGNYKGLVAVVPGAEVREFCLAQAVVLRAKADRYNKQKEVLGEAGFELDNSTSNIKQGAEDKAKAALREAEDLEFIAKYIDIDCGYELDTRDLMKLGKVGGW